MLQENHALFRVISRPHAGNNANPHEFSAAVPSASSSSPANRNGKPLWSSPLRPAIYSGILLVTALASATLLHAQESPYIVTYDHYLEEPGNLDVEYFSTFGTQRSGNDFDANWTEFEYGVNAWWTTEFYLDAQSTFNDSTIFTGFRWENRVRPLAQEHFVNPVFYVEYEQINEADKTMKEIEGHDIESDYAIPNAQARKTLDHELETKLIFSKDIKGWNFALNPLATKNLLPSNPWEFGYATGMSRPLALVASGRACDLCSENFVAGVEMYGGLGDTEDFGLHRTSHYLAPALAWNLPSGWTARTSVGFGLNDNSHRVLVRWGLSREFDGFGEMISRLFGGHR